MSLIVNPLVALWRMLGVWLAGLAALGRLTGIAVTAAGGGDGSFRERAAAQLLRPRGLRLVFTVLRAFVPNLVLSRRLVACYDNAGTAIVTRREDVLDVLRRDADFEVVYEPRMRMITEGENFFLGMQPGWSYLRDVSAMRLAMRRPDATEIVLPRARTLTEEALSAANGHIDLPAALTTRVPADMVATYFGVPGPDAATMVDWATTLFWYLFSDLGADPAVGARARQAAAGLRHHLGTAIAARRSAPTGVDDVLNRCLALGAAGTPGMDDDGIRNNLIGLIIGAIPTISKTTCLALDELLNRPEVLASAAAAARAGDDDGVANAVWEALRFNPFAPFVYRRAIRDTVIARSTARAAKIPQGTLVLAVTLSAMFDPLEVRAPGDFRIDREWETYLPWGHGLHTCFGEAINRLLIPMMVQALLIRPGLRRAPGADGQIDTGDTPFPQHFRVVWDQP